PGSPCRRDRAARTSARVDGLNQAGIADGDVDEPASRVEKCCVGSALQRPLLAYRSIARIYLDQCTVITRDVQQTVIVVDVHSVRASGGEGPVFDVAQVRQTRGQDHRRLADREEHALVLGIDDAPSWPTGKLERPSTVSAQGEKVKFGFARRVAYARGNSEVGGRGDRGAVGPRRRWKHGASLKRGGVQPR